MFILEMMFLFYSVYKSREKNKKSGCKRLRSQRGSREWRAHLMGSRGMKAERRKSVSIDI